MASKKEKAAEKYADSILIAHERIDGKPVLDMIAYRAFLAGVAWEHTRPLTNIELDHLIGRAYKQRDKHSEMAQQNPQCDCPWCVTQRGLARAKGRDKHPYLNEAKRICKEGKKKGGSRK